MTDSRRGAGGKGRGHNSESVLTDSRRRREKVLAFSPSLLVYSVNNNQPEPTCPSLRRKHKTKEITTLYNYHALGEQLANEHLLVTIHPTYLSDPKIAQKIDDLYEGAEGMLKAMHGIVHLQGTLAQHELGLAYQAARGVVRTRLIMENRFHITTIPAVREVETKMRERVAHLLRLRKKHQPEDFDLDS